MKKIWIILILTSCLLCGCSGVKPYVPEGSETQTELDTNDEHESGESETQIETESFQSESTLDTEKSSEVADKPGTLPDVSEIEQPNQSKVGEIGTYSFDVYENATFAYYYNKNTQVEKLVLIEYPSERWQTVVKMFVLETSFGGWEGLKNNLTSTFEAKVLAYKNISFEEGMYAHNATIPGSGMAKYYHKVELVDFSKDIHNLSTIQYYLGSIYDTYPNNDSDAVLNEIANGKYVAVLSNMSETESEKIKSDRTVFERIYERFELNELVSVE